LTRDDRGRAPGISGVSVMKWPSMDLRKLTRTASARGDRPERRRVHATHEPLVSAVDPSYWPRATGLRVVIAAMYFILIPAGVLPMSTAWWMASGGTLLVYSIVLFASFQRWPRVLWIHRSLSPYVDTALVTLAIIALAKPDYPIWVGYMLTVASLSAYQSPRWVMMFSLWEVAVYWSGLGVLHVTGRADTAWQLDVVVSIMLMFTAINSEVISTSNRRLREMVLHASLTDPLTGLANRRRFREVLDSHDVADARPLAVLMYDIDNFKQLNEELGHVHADTVLVRVCDELREVLRDADVVARYGGDELVVLAHVETMEDAVVVGERSLAHVRATADVNMSVGISVYPLTAASLDDAVRSADDALGRAKRAGKARAVVAELRSAA
jgi:diguanylate cyclase (GGDEF)-like protein